MKDVPLVPWTQGLLKAAHCLRQGGVVAFPTDTYYALAANPRNEAALQRILGMYPKDNFMPIPLAGGHESDLEKLGFAFPPVVQTLLHNGWPTGFGVVLPTPAGFSKHFHPWIAVHVTAHPIASHLIRVFGFPVIAVPVRGHNDTLATDALSCAHLNVDLVLDAGPVSQGKPLTLAQLRLTENGEMLFEGESMPPTIDASYPEPGWTQDKIPGCDAFVFQPAHGGYRFNLDSILLVDFAVRCAPSVQHFLDVGCNTGVCLFALQTRFPKALGRGLELDEMACRAARIAASLQGLRNRLEFIQGDLAMEKTLLPGDAFDLVVSNPPYYTEGGRVNHSEALRRARHDHDAVFLQNLFACARRVLRSGGVLAIVLPAWRVAHAYVLAAAVKLVPFRFQVVYPYASQSANRVLMAFVKARKPLLEILPPLVVHTCDGYTPQLREILKMF